MADILDKLSAKCTELLSYCSPSLVATTIGLLVFIAYQRRRRRLRNAPPCYSGWIPWLGCAIEFGKSPLTNIEEFRRKLGPVFTLKVAGKRLTFVTDSEDFHHFFQSENVDFQEAVQDSVKNAAAVSRLSFMENHTRVHDLVKGRLSPWNLEPFCHRLSVKFVTGLEKWGSQGTGDLKGLLRKVMYVAILDNLFGNQTLPTNPEHAFAQLEKQFVNFDEGFEYGTRLPDFIYRNWSDSKWWLLDLFKGVVKKVENQNIPEERETVLQSLIKAVDRAHAPNYGLLLMWASLANAIPITFWTVAYILSDEEVLKELKLEINEAMKGKDTDFSKVRITQEELQKMPALKRSVLEAIRLRSPGVITRGVTKPFTCKGYTIPAGDMLMLSPYWAHRNPKHFPDPDAFNPSRWKAAELDKNLYLEGFVAFGGGRYQCPGRWFALLEIQLIVALLLYRFDFKLLKPLPKASPLHVVGTQQPETPLLVEYALSCRSTT